MMRFISPCSLSTTRLRRAACASSTCHDTVSKSGAPTASPIGGRSGTVGSRVDDVTASARSLPSRISGSDAPASANAIATWPAATSAIDCGLLR